MSFWLPRYIISRLIKDYIGVDSMMSLQYKSGRIDIDRNLKPSISLHFFSEQLE